MIQDKAQFAVKGYSLNKDCNAVLSHLWACLRARREAAIRGVAPLGKDQPFPARRALQLTAARHAEGAMYTMQYTSMVESGANQNSPIKQGQAPCVES